MSDLRRHDDPCFRERIGAADGDSILVLGAYGVSNTGDEAILAGLLSLTGRERVTVISRDPAETSRMHHVRSVAIGRALPELLKHDVLVIGGGGLFSRHMGSFGRFIPLYGLLARRFGLRVSIEGVGIDSAPPSWVKCSLAWLAKRCVSLRVRDDASRALLDGERLVEVGPDLSAYMEPAAAPREFLGICEAAAGRPVVGLCLNGVDARVARRLLATIPSLVSGMPEVRFCFIPMSQHPGVRRQNDLRLADDLQGLAPELAVLRGTYAPWQILGAFGYLSAVIGMRFHSLLFAQRAGVPLIAYAYAEKCQRWLAENDTPEVELSLAALRAAVSDAVDRKAMEVYAQA
jgi:N-acetylglucosaminyldiphosphoundecaprenol N-acetyl-beta-D-mannosaminyltransferase